jgi:hypothetical protein
MKAYQEGIKALKKQLQSNKISYEDYIQKKIALKKRLKIN